MSGSKLLAPPPRTRLPVQNHLQRKHETSPRNSKSVRNPAKPVVKKAEQKKKAGGGILTSLVNSVISLFPFGNKKLSVKVVRSKSQNVIKSKQFVKKQPKKLKPAKNLKLPHKNIPIKLKSHIRQPSTHFKNTKIPVKRPLSQAASISVNENSLPNKRQIKNLVVELHKTVEDILQKQSSNKTSSNSSSRVINQTGVRNIAPVVTSISDKPPQTADTDQASPPPERAQHQQSASNGPERSSENNFLPQKPDKMKRRVNNKRYQTSFSANSLKIAQGK